MSCWRASFGLLLMLALRALAVDVNRLLSDAEYSDVAEVPRGSGVLGPRVALYCAFLNGRNIPR
jgi:hypothetical protein